LAVGSANAAAANGAGITIAGASATITYASGTDSWDLNKDVNVTGDVTATTFNGDLVGNVTGTVSDISNHDTDALSEGATNFYFTNTRARNAVSATTVSGDGTLSYNSTTGVFSFAGPTDTDYRGAVSANSVSGDGSLNYDSTTGVFSYAGPDDTDYRGAVSATKVSGDGNFAYNSTTGVFSYTGPDSADYRGAVSANTVSGDGSLSYDSITGVFSFTGPTNSDYRGAVSATKVSGDGNFTYNSTTGVFSYTGPSAGDSRAHFSATGDLTYNSGTGVFDFALANHDTDDLAEGGTNLYFTNARAAGAVSLTTDDNTVLAYDSATGAFTFDLGNVNTDKVAEGSTNLYHTVARARGALSAGSNINYNSSTGVISTDAAVHSVNGATGVVTLDTDDITEGTTNLYFTDTRARGAVSLTTDDANILAYNGGTGVFTFVTPDTDAIDEGATNLYYTDVRADGRIAAASIRDLSDVDADDALQDGYTLVWSVARNEFVPQNIAVTATTLNFTGDGTSTSFSTGVEVSSIDNTQVFVNGLIQAPTYSYTLSTVSNVTSIVFDTAPELNDYIFVRVTATSSLTAGGILNENSNVDGGSF
jgi:hypothetical protein